MYTYNIIFIFLIISLTNHHFFGIVLHVSRCIHVYGQVLNFVCGRVCVWMSLCVDVFVCGRVCVWMFCGWIVCEGRMSV